jgi:hypothetical protein
MRGWNPRKGVSATQDELLDELADVMLTAAVAMASITQDARRAGEIFQQRLATVVTRAGLDIPASSVRHWTASAIVLHPDNDQVLLIDHVKSGLVLFAGGHVQPGSRPGQRPASAHRRHVRHAGRLRPDRAARPP